MAAWLGGASWATLETRPRAREWAVAVAAALPALGTLLGLATSRVPPLRIAFGMAGYVVAELFSLLVGVGSWWVVLEQAQCRQALGWHGLRPVLRVPALAAALGTAYAYLPFMSGVSLEWLSLGLGWQLGHGLPSCAVGAAAIWLNQRRRRPEVSAEA